MNGPRLHVLLTNDDGIHAPGLYALHESLKRDFDLTIVAPEVEMSAVGHAITLSTPLRVRRIRKARRFYGYAVNGTPADCVKIAIQELLERPPDVVLSGINLGANVGVNVLYSGTVSAATEGAFLGVPSAAFSLATLRNPDYRFAARFSRRVIGFLRGAELRVGTALNVNIPAVPEAQIRGVVLTRQGVSRFIERFEKRTDPRGHTYYWLTGETPVESGNPDTDGMALKNNYITITPIQYDLTCHSELERLKSTGPQPFEKWQGTCAE
ncbi:5'/3'-nucleotidase SurE [Desulfatiglans anilini]|uniref:5'/3'-nucleotidase SurE n=1 Tax=Desulfatiglans anilini TaxID=90728 RepID=UPI0004121246|nr:5'/3'-nucleotidase SurE [Desulfatiglans anilini]